MQAKTRHIIWVGLLLWAEANGQPAKPVEAAPIRVNSNLVMLPTRVETKTGDTVYGLNAEQFVVKDNGVRQAVEIVDSPDSASLSLVVAIQCGRSAPEEFGNLKGLATMIDAIVGASRHEVAVVVYGERPYLLSDFSRASEVTRAALSQLKPCGDYHAASIDAVSYSLNLLRRRNNRYRHAILLIGEQRDHGSASKAADVVAELGTTDTVIYSVAFSPTKGQFLSDLRNGPNGPHKNDAPVVYSAGAPPSKPKDSSPAAEQMDQPQYTDQAPLFSLPPLFLLAANAVKENTASEMATLSGGEYFDFSNAKGFERALHRISNQIHNYYLLSFRPDSSSEPASHSLDVKVKGRSDVVIQTRKSYWSGVP
jgi:VWFA-related protein